MSRKRAAPPAQAKRAASQRSTERRKERRAPESGPGTLRWVKGLLGRPVRLERRDGGVHLALVERRRSPEIIEAEERERLCARLRRRLREHAEVHPVPLRLLVGLHNTLLRGGWPAVEQLSSATLAKLRVQFALLMEGVPPNTLSGMAQRLQLLQAAAEAREDRAARLGRADVPRELDDTLDFKSATLVIEEGNDSEYALLARAWEDTEAVEIAGANPSATYPGRARPRKG